MVEKRGFYMNNYNTDSPERQAILKKLCLKRKNNKEIIKYLRAENQEERGKRINECGTYIGITEIENVAHIVKSNFCRDRLCSVCAWRRQAKFIAQTMPILNKFAEDYRFLYITLTMKNCIIEDVKKSVDELLAGFHRLTMKRKYKRVFKGLIRSIEITYNEDTNMIHPHIHILAVVDRDYFSNPNKYISQSELQIDWKKSMRIDYEPVVDVRAVDDTGSGAVETLKYSLKPTIKHNALKAFDMLKGKRLISFTGIIREARAELKYSGIEDINDYDNLKGKVNIKYDLYKFDVNGGLYKYINTYEVI